MTDTRAPLYFTELEPGMYVLSNMVPTELDRKHLVALEIQVKPGDSRLRSLPGFQRGERKTLSVWVSKAVACLCSDTESRAVNVEIRCKRSQMSRPGSPRGNPRGVGECSPWVLVLNESNLKEFRSPLPDLATLRRYDFGCGRPRVEATPGSIGERFSECIEFDTAIGEVRAMSF